MPALAGLLALSLGVAGLPAVAGAPAQPDSAKEQRVNLQQRILDIVRAYNAKIHHDDALDGVIGSGSPTVFLKMPDKIYIFQNDTVATTIRDKKLLQSIRYALYKQYTESAPDVRCEKYVLDDVWDYALGKLKDRVVRTCLQYPPVPNADPTAAEPQATAFPPDCRIQPNGRALCE